MENKYFFSSSHALTTQKKDVFSHSVKVIEGLCRLLVSTRALCRESLYCHWQATEPELEGLHALFEQHYQSLRNAIDIIADRIRRLGYNLPSQSSPSIWGTKCANSSSEMIGRLIRNHQACAQEARNVLIEAEATGDDISSNIAAQRVASHERAAWLLLALPAGLRPTHYGV